MGRKWRTLSYDGGYTPSCGRAPYLGYTTRAPRRIPSATTHEVGGGRGVLWTSSILPHCPHPAPPPIPGLSTGVLTPPPPPFKSNALVRATVGVVLVKSRDFSIALATPKCQQQSKGGPRRRGWGMAISKKKGAPCHSLEAWGGRGCGVRGVHSPELQVAHLVRVEGTPWGFQAFFENL